LKEKLFFFYTFNYYRGVVMKTNKFLTSVIKSSLLMTSMGILLSTSVSANAAKLTTFKMQPSSGVSTCLPKAIGYVTVSSLGPVENMHVEVRGLPPRAEFDLFITQVPDKPFGMAWYQGDIETDAYGRGVADFTGRFNVETFLVAPGSDIAPWVHGATSPFPDATTNPVTAPIHTYHVGLWFNSPNDAVKAGCAGTVTPFNGEHNAGIQVLNTAQFAKNSGPLFRLKP
jgi:hypothetical protein